MQQMAPGNGSHFCFKNDVYIKCLYLVSYGALHLPFNFTSFIIYQYFVALRLGQPTLSRTKAHSTMMLAKRELAGER
jgi:hypothetical protein